MTKQEMEQEIKLLRRQLIALKNESEKRESKMFKVFEMLEPFFPVLLSTEEERIQFLKAIDDLD